MSGHTPGYEVLPDGRVFSVSSNWRGYGKRLMRQTLNADGYPSVRVIVEGKRVRLAVHRLVAAHFLPPRPSHEHEVRHLNGDKMDNSVANLAWGTAAENARDRELHGRTSRGERHAAAIRAGIAKSTNTFWRHAR